MKGVIIIATLTVLTVTACNSDGSRVKIWFKSSQIDSEYALTAIHALAVPQETDIKVYFFADDRIDCSRVGGGLSVAEIYIPTRKGGVFGAKFAPPQKPTWAAGISATDTPPVTELTITESAVDGLVDFKVNKEKGGNVGGMKGRFHAAVCTANPVAGLSAKNGSSEVKLNMDYPDDSRDWSTTAGTAIAFLARDRVMLFFQESRLLTCENYRLELKYGLVEFLYTEDQTTFGPTDVNEVKPVDPKTGWSHHYGPDQIEVTAANATISTDRKRVSGSLDVTVRGIDPKTMKNVYKNDPEATKWSSKVSGRIHGTFDAPICPEF